MICVGIQERRQRERARRRTAILEAARELARADGWEGVTVRKLAERIEYSPPTIYEDFASKEAIINEIVRLGFASLADRLSRAKSRADDETMLIKVSLAYWRFAQSEPHIYDAMFRTADVSFETAADKMLEAQIAFDVIRSAVDRAQAAGGNTKDATVVLWSLLHGITSLTLAHRIEGGARRGEQLIQRGVETFMAGGRGEPAGNGRSTAGGVRN